VRLPPIPIFEACAAEQVGTERGACDAHSGIAARKEQDHGRVARFPRVTLGAHADTLERSGYAPAKAVSCMRIDGLLAEIGEIIDSYQGALARCRGRFRSPAGHAIALSMNAFFCEHPPCASTCWKRLQAARASASVRHSMQ